ncbi:hypothetical protein Tco_0361024 [Tanacetum coccineum]
MHTLVPHYERKTRSYRGKKRPRESNARSYSTTLNHPSSSHPLDDPIDENDDESFHYNPSSPSQNVSSSSNDVSRVYDLGPDDESVDTPLVSPFLDSDDDSDDGEVLNELEEYGIFTYIEDFVILEDIGEFIIKDMAEVVMGKPFRKVTKLEYDCANGLMYFTRIFDNYTFQMPRTIPRFKNWGHISWRKIPPHPRAKSKRSN